MRQTAAAFTSGSVLGRTIQQLWPGSLQALSNSCFTATQDKTGSCQSARPRPLVTASALRKIPPHPEIPGSDLPPSSGTSPATPASELSAQPPGSTIKQRPAEHSADSTDASQANPQQQATEQSTMSQVFVPNEPNMPESSIRPAPGPQQGAAFDKPEASLDGAPAQHQLPGVPGDLIPPRATPQGSSLGDTLLAQASDSKSQGYWAGRVPVPESQQKASDIPGDLVPPGVPPQGNPQGDSSGQALLSQAADSAGQGYWADRVPGPPPQHQLPGVPGDLVSPGVPPQGTSPPQVEPAQQASSEGSAGQGYWAGRVPPLPPQNQMPGLPRDLIPPGVPPQGTPKSTSPENPSLPKTADSAGQGYWAGRIPAASASHPSK